MALKFSQKEIELAVSEVLIDGDVSKISNTSGIGYSFIDQQLNPNDARRSYIVGALQIICALDEISPERGEAVWRIVCKKRELSKPQTSQIAVDLNHETGELNREISEYVSARITGKPFHEQMKEFLDIEAQLARVKQAMIDEFNRLQTEEPAKSISLKAVK